MNIKEVTDQVQKTSALDDATKAQIIADLQKASDSGDQEVLYAKLNEAIELIIKKEDEVQAEIDDTFDEAGVSLDENDPAYKKAYSAMAKEVASAEAEFNDTIEGLSKEADKIEEDGIKQIDQLKMEDAQNKLGKD